MRPAYAGRDWASRFNLCPDLGWCLHDLRAIISARDLIAYKCSRIVIEKPDSMALERFYRLLVLGVGIFIN